MGICGVCAVRTVHGAHLAVDPCHVHGSEARHVQHVAASIRASQALAVDTEGHLVRRAICIAHGVRRQVQALRGLAHKRVERIVRVDRVGALETAVGDVRRLRIAGGRIGCDLAEQARQHRLHDPALAEPVDDGCAEQVQTWHIQERERAYALHVLAHSHMRCGMAAEALVQADAVDAARDKQVVEQEHVRRRRVRGVHRGDVARRDARHDPRRSERELGVQAVQHTVAHEALHERGARQLARRLQLLVPVAARVERVGGERAGEQERRLGAQPVRVVLRLAREPRRSG